VSFVGRRFGFGLVLEIEHNAGVKTRYAHLATTVVKPGERVARGAAIATVGTSGLSTGPHLHYEVLVRGHQVDPMRFRLPQVSDSVSTPAASPTGSEGPASPTVTPED
jgi:murein DD-endopeptidase MepM/ murein hydrolase activator NlpD